MAVYTGIYDENGTKLVFESRGRQSLWRLSFELVQLPYWLAWRAVRCVGQWVGIVPAYKPPTELKLYVKDSYNGIPRKITIDPQDDPSKECKYRR